jgi:hypothetical protein
MRWASLILSVIAFAQNPVGELVLEKRQPRPLFLEHSLVDEGLVFISYRSVTSSRTLTLHKYGQDLRHEWSVDLYDQDSGEELTQLAVLDTLIWVFTQQVRGKALWLLAYRVTLEGKVLRRAERVLELPTSEEKRIELTYAPNRRWACLSLSMRRPADSLDQMGYFLIGPDTAFGGLWNLPYPEKDLEIRRPLQPGYDGTLYALGKVRETTSPYPTYVLFKYVPTEALTLQVPLEVSEMYLIEPTFRIERQGIRIGAFYSQRKGAQVQGIVLAEIRSPGLFLRFTHKTPLPTEILQRYLSERQIARGRGIPDLYLDHLIPRQDGGAILIGEQFYITTMTFRDFYGFWQTQEVYHYDDILILAVDSVGGLEWIRVLPKSQSSASNQELSYGLLVGPDQLYVIYRSYARGMGSQIFVVTVNESGEMSSPRPLISGFRGSDVFYRRFTRQLSNTEGLIAYYRQRNGQFVMLRLEL